MNTQNTNRVIVLLSALFFVAMNPFCFADITSSSYKICQSELTSGGGSGSSSSYQLSESAVRPIAGGSLSSANYSVEGKSGISSNINIPTIQSITPAGMARFYTDQSASFSVQATTPDSAPLQYQVKQDTTVKAGPQSSSTLTWALGSSDKGRHTIPVSAIGPDGTTSTNQNAYFYRRPVK